jgi:hypothetical protein
MEFVEINCTPITQRNDKKKGKEHQDTRYDNYFVLGRHLRRFLLRISTMTTNSRLLKRKAHAPYRSEPAATLPSTHTTRYHVLPEYFGIVHEARKPMTHPITAADAVDLSTDASMS